MLPLWPWLTCSYTSKNGNAIKFEHKYDWMMMHLFKSISMLGNNMRTMVSCKFITIGATANRQLCHHSRCPQVYLHVYECVFTFIGFSTSPPHSVCTGIRKGFHIGFRLFLTTCRRAPALKLQIVWTHFGSTILFFHTLPRTVNLESKEFIHTSVLWANCHPVPVCL